MVAPSGSASGHQQREIINHVSPKKSQIAEEIHLYNSLSRQKQNFDVTTVHIQHARTTYTSRTPLLAPCKGGEYYVRSSNSPQQLYYSLPPKQHPCSLDRLQNTPINIPTLHTQHHPTCKKTTNLYKSLHQPIPHPKNKEYPKNKLI